jgi:hypothetical protein
MSAPGENVKSSAAVSAADPLERLEWQHELDSAMSDIDSRLQHPRRRAGDAVPQPTVTQLGQVDMTGELLDEIAWRVTEQIRRSRIATAPTAPASEPSAYPPARSALWQSPPAWPEAFEPESAPASDAALVIRLRRPLFRWPFRRLFGRRQATSIGGYRAT